MLIGAGIAVGALAGFLGIGGTPLIAPAILFALLRVPTAETVALRTSFGSALAAAAVLAGAGYVIHRRRANGQLGLAYVLGPAVAVGAFAGGSVASRLGPDALRTVFAVGAFLIAAWMLLSTDKEASQPRSPALWLGVPMGLAIGFFAALAGMGGAVFSIIILVNLFGYSMRTVTATSSFVQTCGAAFGCVGYAAAGWGKVSLVPLSLGYVNLPAAACVAAAGVPMAILGARFAHAARPGIARKVFAAVLVALALHMLRVF